MNRRGFFGTLSKCAAAVAAASVVKLESSPAEIDDVPEGEPYATKSLPVSPTACAKCGKELVDAHRFVPLPSPTSLEIQPWNWDMSSAVSSAAYLQPWATGVSLSTSSLITLNSTTLSPAATYFQPEQPEQYIELDGKRICLDCLVG